MFRTAVVIASAPLVLGVYAYVGYPAVLWLLARLRPSRRGSTTSDAWPTVTITVPVYNGASTIRETLDRLLKIDYPRDRLQLLVISDGSTDATDDIVREHAGQGVELLRMQTRRGKTIAENAAVAVATGELIVNVDATILLPPQSLKALVRVFDDPTIGVASGQDVSVGDANQTSTGAESGYVGYEMWVRSLETRLGSIVGASGCFYAIRRRIHSEPLPADLSWDFASVLVARLKGLRSVSVPDAVCFVPRAVGIGTEMNRKVRTMARGIRTLFHHAELMNPVKYGGFALMLISHKLVRWLPYLLAPAAALALAFLIIATSGAWALTLGIGVVALGLAAWAVRNASGVAVSPTAAFLAASFVAGSLAWWDVVRRAPMAMWDPTARPRTQP